MAKRKTGRGGDTPATPSDELILGRLAFGAGPADERAQLREMGPAAWIAESTREHSRAVELGNLAYGYLWWVIDSENFAALGDGGNVIYINTKKRIMVSITAFLKPNVKDRIGWIKTEIEPLLT